MLTGSANGSIKVAETSIRTINAAPVGMYSHRSCSIYLRHRVSALKLTASNSRPTSMSRWSV